MSLSSAPPALQPLFKTTRLNEPITIYEGELQLIITGRAPLVCQGSVQWRWLISPELFIKAEASSVEYLHDAFLTSATQIAIPGIAPFHFSSTNIHIGETMSISGHPRSIYKPAVTPPQRQLYFHLPNFPNYNGESISAPPSAELLGSWRRGRMSLKAAGWVVTLDNLAETKTLAEELRETGGYAITHTGKLEREDEALFTLEEAQAFMECINFFLSFVAGRWTQPVLWWIFSGDDSQSTQMIIPANQRLDSWRQTNSWANTKGWQSGEDISGLFPAFVDRFTQASKLLRLSISWYIEALSSQLVSDSRIVLTQVGLELLAEALPPLVGAGALKGPAEHRLRGLLKLVMPSLNTAVPASLTCLVAVLSQPPAMNWNKSTGGVADGPSVVVSMRNLIAHGARKPAEKALLANSTVMYEASQLGLWYLELVLLNWLDYEGHYKPRIVIGGWIDDGETL
ncbi:hypothetical protein [Hymenobacter metallicola]|uniref:YopA central domain-containing protein n=1 Tax=Hymenobacter metallicola TaxID=2563114 RepID=A0A4Z0Q322_9BACT|nr:hypothetical protein [Hymenobacter metallicola]TGE23533.1 hypothetical protein E5K02_20320 [Hymenobacter metallicola]